MLTFDGYLFSNRISYLFSEMGRQIIIDGDCQEKETRMREVGDIMVENLYPSDDDLGTPPIIDDDDNFSNINRRTRRKKPTNKFNRRLWFIPTHVLNNREDQGKGKRQGLTTYTRLSCRDCNTTFHTNVGFRLHSHSPPFYPTVVGGWDKYYFSNFIRVASAHRYMDSSQVHTLLWQKWSGNSQPTRPKKLRKVIVLYHEVNFM